MFSSWEWDSIVNGISGEGGGIANRHEYPMWVLFTWYRPNGHMVRGNGHMVPTEIIVWGTYRYIKVWLTCDQMYVDILVDHTTNSHTQHKSKVKILRTQRMEGVREERSGWILNSQTSINHNEVTLKHPPMSTNHIGCRFTYIFLENRNLTT